MTAKVMAVFAVQILLWLYLVWRGRTPERCCQYESDAGGAAGSILDRGTQACANAGKSGKNGNGTVSGDSVYLCRSADKDREGGKCGTHDGTEVWKI